MASELQRAQNRLYELMDQYRKAPDDETRQGIENQIARLKAQINELLERQAKTLKSVRDEYINPEALMKMASQENMMASLDRLQTMMAEGKIDQAMQELERLQSQIDQLSQAIDKSRFGFGSKRYQKLAKAMQRIQGGLGRIVKEQQQLLKQTKVMRKKTIEQMAHFSKSRSRQVLDGLLKRLAGLTQRISTLKKSALAPRVGQDRDRVLERARDLGKALQAADLFSSREMSAALTKASSRLKQAFESLALWGAGQKPSVTQVRLAHKEALGIEKALARLLPGGKQLLSQKEQAKARDLGRQQKRLGQRLGRLSHDMQKQNEEAPLFGLGEFEEIDGAGRSMQKASADLNRLEPESAFHEQQSALAQLEKMQQAMQKNAGSGSGMPLPLGHAGRVGEGFAQGLSGGEKVKIPGADDYQPPASFRKELLDGMKDPVPDDFQFAVRRYYEELVK
jgi:hypothetical protein